MMLAAFILACVAGGLAFMKGAWPGLLLSVSIILMLWPTVIK